MAVVLGILVFLGWRAAASTEIAEVDPTTTTEVQSVILDYSLAMQTGDEVMLDEVLHEYAAGCEYEGISPGQVLAFRHADRRALLAGGRSTALEEYSPTQDTDRIEVLDATAKVASACLAGAWGTEQLHLLRTGDDWKIVHVLRMGVNAGS